MANLDLTELNTYISSETDDENKKYGYQSGLIQNAMYNTRYQEYMTEQIKNKVKNANGQQIDISALVDSEFTVQTALSFVFDANISTSAKTTLAVVTAWTGFYEYPGQYGSNSISRETDMASKYRKADKALGKYINEALYTRLNSRRTQVFSDSISNAGESYDGTGDNLDIALAAWQGYPVFESIVAMFNDNGIEGGAEDFNIVGNSGLVNINAYRNQFGQANDKNLQALNMQSFIDSSGKIVNPSGTQATSFVMKNGAIALTDVVPLEFAGNFTVGNFAEFGVGDMELPHTGMRPLVYREEALADATAYNGSPMSKVIKHGIGHQFVISTNYCADLTSKVNDILRVEFLNS